MPTSLPDRPHLDQLRRQAKELLHAAGSGERPALDRIRAVLRSHPQSAITLSTAQLAVAREYGFASWAALAAEVRMRTMSLEQRLTSFVLDSVQGYFDGSIARQRRDERAKRLLAEDAVIAGRDICVAAVLGDAARVAAALARDPAAALRPEKRSGWPPLLFGCRSR